MSRDALIRGFRGWVSRRAIQTPDADFIAADTLLRTREGETALAEVIDAWETEETLDVASGIAIYRSPQGADEVASVLLVHPTGQGHLGTYSVPKGHEEGIEDPAETAVREVEEETGIKVPFDTVKRSGDPVVADRPEREGRPAKRVLAFLVDDAKLMGKRIKTVLPRTQLQLEEVDWAGFVPLHEAATKIAPEQLPILEAVAQRTRRAPAPKKAPSKFTPGDVVKVKRDDTVALPGTLDGDVWAQRGIPWEVRASVPLRVVAVRDDLVIVRRAGERGGLHAIEAADLVRNNTAEVPRTARSEKKASEKKGSARPPSPTRQQPGLQGYPPLYDAAAWPAKAGAALERVREPIETMLGQFGISRVRGGSAHVAKDLVTMTFASKRGDLTASIKPLRDGSVGVRASIEVDGRSMVEARGRPVNLDRLTAEDIFPEEWLVKVMGFAALHGSIDHESLRLRAAVSTHA